MVSQSVGSDAGKKIKGRKRFVTVDTLGLVLRVLVTAANVGEREGGKQVLKRVKQSQKQVSRLTTLWVDGGFDGEPFLQWVMDFCRWIVQVVLRPEHSLGLCLAQKTLGGGAHFRLGHGMSAIGQRLRTSAGNIGDVYLSCHDPDHGKATGMKFDPTELFKHPLNKEC